MIRYQVRQLHYKNPGPGTGAVQGTRYHARQWWNIYHDQLQAKKMRKSNYQFDCPFAWSQWCVVGRVALRTRWPQSPHALASKERQYTPQPTLQYAFNARILHVTPVLKNNNEKKDFSPCTKWRCISSNVRVPGRWGFCSPKYDKQLQSKRILRLLAIHASFLQL